MDPKARRLWKTTTRSFFGKYSRLSGRRFGLGRRLKKVVPRGSLVSWRREIPRGDNNITEPHKAQLLDEPW